MCFCVEPLHPQLRKCSAVAVHTTRTGIHLAAGKTGEGVQWVLITRTQDSATDGSILSSLDSLIQCNEYQLYRHN